MANQISKLDLLDYKDIVVTNSKGKVIFFDIANINMFDLRPQDIIGNKVTSLYKNLSDKNSTIMKVLKLGEPILHHKQKLKTKKDNNVYQIGSTFPIVAKNTILGAVEFSKYLYTNESIKLSKTHSNNKVFRKNNTFYTIDDIITDNKNMNDIKKNIRKIANTDSSVLICGETGTGKEMVAQAIHNLSKRCYKPFISQNCSAIPKTLFESAFFGTVEGSFTGSKDSKGLFEQATGGTLFIDEILSLDQKMQVKLLKAIEDKRIRKIGGSKYINLDIRIIASINEDPLKAIKKGLLRQDLFYRLGVAQIYVPALRDRRNDISLLIKYFINYYNNLMNRSIKGVSNKVLKFTEKYNWPGNVRELKHMVEGAFNTVEDEIININNLPDHIKKTYNEDYTGNKLNHDKHSLRELVESYELNIIKMALKKTHGNYSAAAKNLDLSRQALKYKIDKYKL